jgi:hypothetical protein
LPRPFVNQPPPLDFGRTYYDPDGWLAARQPQTWRVQENFMSRVTPRSAPPFQLSQDDALPRAWRAASNSNGGRNGKAHPQALFSSQGEEARRKDYAANNVPSVNELRRLIRPRPPADPVDNSAWMRASNGARPGQGRHGAPLPDSHGNDAHGNDSHSNDAHGNGAPGDPQYSPRFPHAALESASQFVPKINLEGYWQPSHHRSGWRYALDSLRSLHSAQGVLFDGFVEKKFVWGSDPGERHNAWAPYSRPWVGVLHNPPRIPDWFNMNGQSPSDILRTPCWQQSMASCCGIFTLSNYLKHWLEQRVPVPVCSLYHPTEIPETQFSPLKFRQNKQKKIVQIGWWLRKFESLYRLRVQGFGKLLLDLGQGWIDDIRNVELAGVGQPEIDSVELSPYLDNQQYDELLSQNIAFLHLYDSSANNALIECIARATPVLINPLPAVLEYLGPDYPFYFHTLAEAARKAEDTSLVLAAHEYLRQPALRQKLTGEYFLRSLVHSEIYRQLPEARATYWHGR